MAQDLNLKENNWTITLENFYEGASPVAHLDLLTEVGNGGHYSQASCIDITVPKYLTQGPYYTQLDPDQTVDELINYILDIPPLVDKTYGIGNTKLFQIEPTIITHDLNFPHTITDSTEGQSIIGFQGDLYYFYNTSTAGDIGKYDLDSTFDDDWGSTIPTGAGTLQKAPHPVATKENIMIFGNGQYVGTYFSDTATLTLEELDFGTNTQIADVAFFSNQWLIAVNTGVDSDTNRSSASLYLWDAGASTAVLSDEVSVGIQKIGFIKVFNGTIFICYKDIGGHNILGYVSGRTITPLVYFKDDLPDFKQKSVYKGYIMWVSSSKIYLGGSATPDFPMSISPYAEGFMTTIGGIAVPFGTPIVASANDSSESYPVSKFSGYTTDATWQSIIFPTVVSNAVGYIDRIVVSTNDLASDAQCDMTIYGNQNTDTSTSLEISGEGKQRHSFTDRQITLKEVNDFSIKLDWSNGSFTNPVKIRKIIIKGHWKEKA